MKNNEAWDEIEVDRVYLRNNLRLYIKEAWHVVEPSTVYLENWHIELIAEYLEAVTAGQIKRLLINMPPRYARSTCVSIMWPTWVWAHSIAGKCSRANGIAPAGLTRARSRRCSKRGWSSCPRARSGPTITSNR